ncbi:zinc finger and SCAN domain-containing protein 20-like isoform X2 [Gouania willdenowi]|uniref:zinc finger and SCAN domain-containing protein 20-like isoform X2 n=1 Tax=Gouania willdenowi TaxID=441366 RepID=UPI001055C3A3|nr:zinc finger and SCAN domain-containing protein 20-like isoform X2 [Gouania willdenowi]
MATSKGSHWSDNEIECLINIWAEDGIQQQLEKTHKNSAVFRKFRDHLSRRGYVRSTEQCRNKVKKLRMNYKRVRDAPRTVKAKYRWFDAIDQIIGRRECHTVVVGSPMDGPSPDEGPGTPPCNVFSSRNNPDADTKPPESQDALLFLIKTEDDDTKHPIKSGPSDESNDEQGVGVAMSEDNTSASEAEATASPQGVSARPSSSSRRRRRKRTNETTAAFMELQKRHHEDFMEAEKERQRQELDMFSDWMREQRDMEERRQQEAHLMFQQLLSFLQRPSQATPPEQPQTEKHNY